MANAYDQQYLQHQFTTYPYQGFGYCWDIESVRRARDAILRGSLREAAALYRDIKTDAAIYAAVLNRIAPSLGLPSEFISPGGSGHAFRSGGLAERVRVEAKEYFDPRGNALSLETQADLFEILSGMGIFVGQNVWTPRADGTRIDVRLIPFPAECIDYSPYLNPDGGLIGYTTEGIIPIIPNDGKWVVCKLRSCYPWEIGAIVPTAEIWPDRAIGRRDRSKNAESHGEGKWIGTPKDGVATDEGDGKKFAEDLQKLRRARAGMVKPFGYEVEFVEAMSQGWQIFRELIISDNSDIAKIWLGQDGTVNNSGGNYIKSDVLFGVRNDIVERDLLAAERGLRSGLFAPWAAINFGDPSVSPYKHWLMPDLDEEARLESLATRTKAFNDSLMGYRLNGFDITQDFVDYLAGQFNVSAPQIGKAPSLILGAQGAPNDQTPD